MTPEIFSAQSAQREGLSYNPILTLLETVSALKRNDHADFARMEFLAKHAEQRMFEHNGVRRRLYFTIAPPGELQTREEPKEFTGFHNREEEWMMKFGSEVEELMPVSSLLSSLQVQNVREEIVTQEVSFHG